MQYFKHLFCFSVQDKKEFYVTGKYTKKYY